MLWAKFELVNRKSRPSCAIHHKATAASPILKMSELASQYQKLQGELEEFVVARQKLETQLQENKIVDDEFGSLKADSKVYKLTGNVLLPVEQDEARLNVSKRLQFIQSEIDRCESNIKGKQQEQEKVKEELIKLRNGQH